MPAFWWLVAGLGQVIPAYLIRSESKTIITREAGQLNLSIAESQIEHAGEESRKRPLVTSRSDENCELRSMEKSCCFKMKHIKIKLHSH